ncbi:WHG domain-containing protein [Streptomyces sp. NPDC008121]|uniref:TetR-like C-terminal domain-containing protein n=1 Tax=Streptomyces sp. NPDC008121 TaxID=3364809 RepID=UPI0036E1B505
MPPPRAVAQGSVRCGGVARFGGRLQVAQPALESPAPAEALHRFLTFWTRQHGVLSLELAGHFAGMDLDPARLLAAELETVLPPRP